MTREDVEAVIWRAATYVSDEGTGGYLLGTAAVDAILAAADAYAAETARVTVAAMTAGTRRAIHLSDRTDIATGVACNSNLYHGDRSTITRDPADVTCGRCLVTDVYRAALRGAGL